MVIAPFLPESSEVRIQKGTYNITEGPGGESESSSINYPRDLHVSGGWNSGCTERSFDPALTTINGFGAAASAWRLEAVNENASITLDGIRFLDIETIEFSWEPGCSSSGEAFTVRRTIIDGGDGNAALFFAGRCVQFRLENSLIINSKSSAVFINCAESATYSLTNNTIRNSSGYGLEVYRPGNIGCGTDPIGLNRLHNNLIDKINLVAATPLALNNTYDQLSSEAGGGLFPGSSGNVSVNPGLDSDFRPIEPTSPAINTGTGIVQGGLPGTDIEGNPRVVGGLVDRGAFESSVVPPGPFVLTVTSASDSGTGSLRDIINQANAQAGLNLIQFNISGGCPRLITLASPLPDISQNVIINGFSQPGASFNNLDNGNNGVLCVGVQATQLNEVPWALRVPPNSNAALKVRGLGFGGFDSGGGLLGEAAIFLQGGSGHEIQGNQFSGGFHHITLAGSSEGIRLMNNATGALIGGTSPAMRNTFSDHSLAAINVIGNISGNHSIINNYIGTTPSGLSADGNMDGIRIIQSSDNEILGNLISGNVGDGILISGDQATDNLVGNNRIGGIRAGYFQLCGIPPLPSCPPPLSNRKGIFIDNNASDNVIGAATFSGGPNLIRFATQHGVRVISGQRNRILNNELYQNGSGANELDIDIDVFGLEGTNADCGAAADAKGNRGQNRPVITSAEVSGSQLEVNGELTSCTNSAGFDAIYRIQVFASPDCAANGHGPGLYFLGDFSVAVLGAAQTEQTGVFDGLLEHPWLNLTGMTITATATDLFGNTSEFSQCVEATSNLVFSDSFESLQ